MSFVPRCFTEQFGLCTSFLLRCAASAPQNRLPTIGTACPEELVPFEMNAVRDSVLSPETAIYGSNRPPAVIGAADVEVIRRVIYAGATA